VPPCQWPGLRPATKCHPRYDNLRSFSFYVKKLRILDSCEIFTGLGNLWGASCANATCFASGEALLRSRNLLRSAVSLAGVTPQLSRRCDKGAPSMTAEMKGPAKAVGWTAEREPTGTLQGLHSQNRSLRLLPAPLYGGSHLGCFTCKLSLGNEQQYID
jgi:hypothetical protein